MKCAVLQMFFPECMDSQVVRVQPEGVLRNQSVPPLLPAYNILMGGVDRSDQLRKTYGFDKALLASSLFPVLRLCY